jgi:uncharacterized metal-binding protein
MPSGKTHDFINVALLPATLVAIQPEGLFSFIAGYLFGTFWLTPDLDLPQSRPFQRWGFLSIIWIPYTKVFKHRSIFTHLPILGLTIRLVYLTTLIFATYYILLAILLILDEILGTNLAPAVHNLVVEYLNQKILHKHTRLPIRLIYSRHLPYSCRLLNNLLLQN